MGQDLYDGDYFSANYKNYVLQNPFRKMAFYQRIIFSTLALPSGRKPDGPRPRLLDIGCAFGLFLEFMGPFWERYGVDVSIFAIEAARRNVAGVQFEVGSADTIPFEG